ncbi:hypothetical protein EYF80_017006 [Liparis tanakae]|uniref:Uncharacterized protein n=1 Tax=Liparis tanakae TaxID=230148 RepID=A0A4Z2I607_9TELE|nr:hypothetical protein EYF80_017006 [Liparis tanakae]
MEVDGVAHEGGVVDEVEARPGAWHVALEQQLLPQLDAHVRLEHVGVPQAADHHDGVMVELAERLTADVKGLLKRKRKRKRKQVQDEAEEERVAAFKLEAQRGQLTHKVNQFHHRILEPRQSHVSGTGGRAARHKQVAGSRRRTHMEVWLLRLMSKSSSRAYTECQVLQRQTGAQQRAHLSGQLVEDMRKGVELHQGDQLPAGGRISLRLFTDDRTQLRQFQVAVFLREEAK